MSATAEVHQVLAPVLPLRQHRMQIRVDEDRTGPRSDPREGRGEGGEAPGVQRRRASVREERGDQDHVGAGRAHSPHGGLQTRGERRHGGTVLHEIVGAHQHGDQIGSELQCALQLRAAHVGHALRADREVGVVEAAPRGEEQGEPVRPPAESTVRPGVAQSLGQGVAERDHPPPPSRRGGRGGFRSDEAASAQTAVHGVQRPRLLEVPQELIPEVLPASSLHSAPARVPERSAGLLVPGESGHASAEVGEVPGAVEPAVHAGPHQIERPSATGGDHGHPARVGLLQRLAERLALSRMHEHVEGGQRGGERIPVEPPEEQSVGKLFLQPVPPWPVADDDQTGAGDAVQRGEILHLLLGGEASDVADDDLRSPFRSERVAAPGGWKRSASTPLPRIGVGRRRGDPAAARIRWTARA